MDIEHLVAVFRLSGDEPPDLALELARGGLQVIDREWTDTSTVLLDTLKPPIVALCLPRLDRTALQTAAAVRACTDGFVVAIVPAGTPAGIMQALRMGADVCLRLSEGWPVIAEEIRGLLNRFVTLQELRSEAEPSVVSVGPLCIDAARHEVLLEGSELYLTRTEFRILWTLARAAGRVVPAVDVMRAAHEDVLYEDGEARNLLKVYVRRLRQKMGGHGAMIVTVRGTGHVFDVRRRVQQ